MSVSIGTPANSVFCSAVAKDHGIDQKQLPSKDKTIAGFSYFESA